MLFTRSDDGRKVKPPKGGIEMKRSKAARLVVLTLFTASLVVVAQANAASDIQTSKGTKALIFKFEGLENLGVSAFKGGVGARKFIKDGVAIRPAILFDIGTSSVDVTDGGGELSESSNTFGAEVTIEKYLSGNPSSVAPYVGGQGGVSLTMESEDVTTTVEETRDEINFGVGVVAGFQWGFAEGMSLGGEYSLSATFGTGSSDVGDIQGPDTSRTTIGIGTASLFVSVGWP
jgi:hypothetical protein